MESKRRFIVIFSLMGIFVIYLIVHFALLIYRGELPPSVQQPSGRADRGAILDRNGRFLAIQVRFADISLWRPSINVSIDVLSNELSPILEIPPSEIRDRINSSRSEFIILKRQVDDTAIRHLSALIEEKNIKGVRIQPNAGRLYPERNLASQIIGFVGNDYKGLEGIEYAFNSILEGSGNNGTADGRGSQVILTIDTYVQHILEQIARQTIDETGAEAVMLLAMDPRTGEILGSAAMPDFDPNEFNAYSTANWMNRPVVWAYEPGSVFKVFSMSALMESGAVSSNSVFECTGTYTTNRGSVINCLGSHGRVTAREIIIHSCNAGAAYASDQLSSSAFHQLLTDFGFGFRTGAGSPGETAGYLVRSDQWSDRSKPTIAIGQEIGVSAYQMLQAASAIANDGILVPPKIVAGVMSANGTWTPWENGENRRVLSAQTAQAMRSYMVDASSGIGTGWRAAVEDMSLAVKTGTAQMIDPVTRRYSDTDFIASCIALFPAESPSLILYIAIIKPQGEIYGGRIAAPAIREAAESLIDYLGIPRGRNQQIIHPPLVNIPSVRLPDFDSHVPDFSGLAKRILLPLLLRDDLNVEIRGDGWVQRQTPPAGTPVTRGMTIILELE